MSDTDIDYIKAELAATTITYAKWRSQGFTAGHWRNAMDRLDSLHTSGPTPVFSEEFNGPLSASWNVRDGSTTHNQLATYRASNATVANGVLTLRATQDSSGAYSSGYLDTIGKFSQQYGRWEMRAKLPQAQGMWPAFWLRGNNGLGELDVMEAVGGLPTTSVQTVHQSTNGDMAKAGHEDHLPSGSTADWHVYALERVPGTVKWFVDDRMVFAKTVTDLPWLDQTFNEPMNIRLNLQVGGSMPAWYGKPVVGAPAGLSDFVIDYVRVYAVAA